jgi:glyoxylase-like metal-dependent hydrolase (beta-lactamase superfamily II)
MMKTWHTKSGFSVSCILPGRSNVFLVSGNGKNVLVDGSPGNKWRKLKDKLNNLKIKKIDYLILTHTHYDHAANASKIKKNFGALVIVNKREAGYLERGENIVPHGTVFITRFFVEKFAPAYLSKQKYEPCQSDILIDKRLDLNEFGSNTYIMHTPGHSPGSQSIIIDDEIALTGDAMFGVFPGSIFPPFADDDENLIESWGKLLKTKCYIFLPSHGTPNRKKLVEKEFNKRRDSVTSPTPASEPGMNKLMTPNE